MGLDSFIYVTDRSDQDPNQDSSRPYENKEYECVGQWYRDYYINEWAKSIYGGSGHGVFHGRFVRIRLNDVMEFKKKLLKDFADSFEDSEESEELCNEFPYTGNELVEKMEFCRDAIGYLKEGKTLFYYGDA